MIEGEQTSGGLTVEGDQTTLGQITGDGGTASHALMLAEQTVTASKLGIAQQVWRLYLIAHMLRRDPKRARDARLAVRELRRGARAVSFDAPGAFRIEHRTGLTGGYPADVTIKRGARDVPSSK
jgi:hypothetical protein